MEIKEAHKYSISNISNLNKSKKAGCYYCKSIFNASEVKETTDNGETALCPKCGIDSVLGDSSPFKIEIKTLAKLNNYWF